MALRSEALAAPGVRRLGMVPWSQDGLKGIAVEVAGDVPPNDHGMIRRALIRGSLACEDVGGLSRAMNRQLWAIGYFARVKLDPKDGSVVVGVSNPLIPPRWI